MDFGQLLEQFFANPVYVGGVGTVSAGTIIYFVWRTMKSKGVNLNLGQGLASVVNVVTKVNDRVDKVQDAFNKGLNAVTSQVETMVNGFTAMILGMKAIVVSLDIPADDKTRIVAILDTFKPNVPQLKNAIKEVQDLINEKLDEAQTQIPNQLNTIVEELENTFDGIK